MKIKDFINETFGYKPKDVYLFTLPTNSDSPDSTTVQNSKETTQEIKSVFPSIDVNLDYLKTKYNLLINSDIIVIINEVIFDFIHINSLSCTI